MVANAKPLNIDKFLQNMTIAANTGKMTKTKLESLQRINRVATELKASQPVAKVEEEKKGK